MDVVTASEAVQDGAPGTRPKKYRPPSAGPPVKAMSGAVVSRTVTPKLPVPALPALSVAEQVTVLVPSAKVLPDAGVQTTGTDPSTTSVAVAVYVAAAPVGPVASRVMVDGRTRTGAVVSATVTWKEPLLVLPVASEAEQ